MKMKSNIQYCAFLRGINVGGHALIKMDELRNAFEKMGFENVRTRLASGNVLFESGQSNKKVLVAKIERELKQAFKKDIKVMLRSLADLRKLQLANPFRNVEATPETRLYVTFLARKAKARAISIPLATAQDEFRILKVTPEEVFSVLDLSKGMGTIDAMSVLEKEFSSNVTTRNWNTILKIIKQV